MILLAVQYLGMTLIAGIVYLVYVVAWPTLMPIGLGSFQGHGGSLADVLIHAWPMYVLAAVSLAFDLWHDDFARLRPSWQQLLEDVFFAVAASFFEEVIIRWLLFVVLATFLHAADLIDGWWLRWPAEQLLLPLVDATTFHALHGWLYGAHGWAVGTGLVLANAVFALAHSNHPFVFKLYVWSGGIVLFYLLVQYGLATAICGHVLYNLLYIVGHAFVDA